MGFYVKKGGEKKFTANITAVIFFTLLALKLFGAVDWGWGWILLPLYGPIAVVVFINVILILFFKR
jgi:hypothetical protein